MKDDRLAQIAAEANVARFVSLGPGPTPEIRRVVLSGEHQDESIESLVRQLLAEAVDGSINLRSFRPEEEKGNPFYYGLAKVDEALARIRSLAADGYYVIANETLDVADGGVSGVRWDGWTEFAPEDTPRCVEEEGAAGLPAEVADDLFDQVYGVRTPLPHVPELRVEFSLHPRRVGVRSERHIVWEVGDTAAQAAHLADHIDWPNRFSQFLGDKAFGLLLGHTLGFRVPRAEVLARNVRPFSFGTPGDPDDVWVRTCPRAFSPGHFSTVRGWVDPFRILAEEDPDGTGIGAILVQDGVDAQYSGSVLVDDLGPQVLGVAGPGDAYMAGSVAPTALPGWVRLDVQQLHDRLTRVVGPCRIEWVHDGTDIWLLQLNRRAGDAGRISAGDADDWVSFDPRAGVDALSELVARVQGTRTGIELTRRVGWTSHIGDVIRAAGVPARIRSRRPSAEEAGQSSLW